MDGVYKVSRELRQRAKEHRRAMYADHPDVLRFAKSRRIFLIILAGFALLHLLNVYIIAARGLLSSSYLFQELVKCLVHLLIFFLSAYGPLRASYFLWLIAVPRIGGSLTALSSISALFAASAARGALLTFMPACEMVYTVAISLGAVWLTLIPKSRKNADMVQELHLSYTKYIQANLHGENGGN